MPSRSGRHGDGRATPGSPSALAIAVVAGFILAGCALGTELPRAPTTHGPTAAPGGLSRQQATARALEVAPTAGPAPTIAWASIESSPFVERGANPPGNLVWIVRVEGDLSAPPCPSGFLDRVPSASDDVCLDGEGGVNVVLDYFTGDLLGWIH